MLKKLYLPLFTLLFLVFTNVDLSAQCGLQVDIDPVPRANICLGETVDLIAKTNLTTPIPTVCGLNSDRTCGPGADSIGLSVGSGTIINSYNSSAPEFFGDFGEAQSRSQIIILASELKALGFNGGKLTSMAIDIARLETGKSHTIPNVSIKMACTSASNFSNSFFSGLDEVYSPKPVTFTTTGLFVFSFDQAFDWDGNSNIIIEVCSYAANGANAAAVNWGNFTRDNQPGFACWRQAGNANSNGDCVFTGVERNFNQRPNIRFNICKPKVVNLSYQWLPNDGSLDRPFEPRTTVTTSTNTRYYLTVFKTDDPTCTNTDSIDITVDDPSQFTPTSNSPICEGGTLQFQANTTGVTYFWSGPFFSSSDQNPSIPNATPAASGTYTFLVDKGFCKATKTLQVEVQKTPNTGIPKDSTVCRSSANINLFGLLTGEDAGGTWTDNNTSGILSGNSINPSLLDNTLLPATYSYTYTITNICGTFSTTVNVMVIATKSAGIDDDTTLCETGAAINLLSVLDGSPVSGGVWADLSTTNQMSPGGIFSPTNLGPGTYLFSYTVAGTSPCPNTIGKVTVNVSDQPFAGTDASASICINGSINLFNTLSNSPKPGGTWSDIDNAGGNLNTSTGAYTATSVNPGVYRFRYRVAATAPCLADTAILTLTVKGPPIISNVVSTCAADKSNYTVTFDLSGGDPNTYDVQPAGGTITGASVPKQYTSTQVPDATPITFTVTDGNNCSSSTTTVLKRCACPTQAGNVQTNTPLQICNANCVTVPYLGGYATDGDDTLMYVLHSNPGVTLGGILLQQSSPTFCYVAGAGIQYGVTYYISAVAGNKLPGGLVDLSDQCLSVSQGVPVIFGQISTPSFTFSKNPACPGDNVLLTSSSPDNPTYSWVGPNFTSALQNPSVNAITQSNAGVYTLTVNSNGCSLSTSRTLVVTATPVVAISTDAEICSGQGGNIYFNVTAPTAVTVVVLVSPGNQPVEFDVNPGLNTFPINPATNSTYTLVAAYYDVPGGCNFILNGSASVVVVPVPTVTYAVVGDSTFCFNESNTGKVKFTFKPGISANLTYTLNGVVQPTVTGVSNGFTLDVPTTNPGVTEFNIQSMTLTAGTCSFINGTGPLKFYNLIDPIVTASLDKFSLCQNDSVLLSFDVTASEKIIIDYSVGASQRSIITDKDTAVYIPITANTSINVQKASYQLETTCSHLISKFFNITANPVPIISVDVTTTACNNTNTGVITVASQAPTDQFSLDNSAFGPDGTFENLYSGKHILRVKAVNGCTVTREVEIIAISNLTVNTVITSTACGYDNGSVELSISNGKAPYIILFGGQAAQQGTISNLKAGTYSILVIDSNNCIKTGQAIIDPSIPITINTTDNGPIDCTAPEYSALFITPSGGTGVYTYQVTGKQAQTDSVFHGLWPQTYIVTVTDDRGCVTTKQIKLTSIQKFSISPNIRKPLLCWESRDAEIQVNTIGATLPASYKIEGFPYQSNNVFTGVGPGNFTVYVREDGGCHREQTVSFGVTRPDPIDLEILSYGEPFCFNSTDAFISLKATGGTLQAKQYTINGTKYENFSDFTGLTKGNYILIAKNVNECHSDTINFFLPGPPDIILNSSFTFNAQQSLAEIRLSAFGGSPDYFFSINGTDFSEDSIFENLAPGVYTVYVKDSRGCTTSHTVNVSGVGISENGLNTAIVVFPNPFEENFTISSESSITNVKLRILNAVGQEVYSGKFETIDKNPVTIKPASSLAAGVYNIELRSDQGTTIRKIIKQ